MQNLINWFEIPATDFSRTITFYCAVLDVEFNKVEIFGTKMGFFPSDGTNVSGAIVEGEGYRPSTDRIIAYLNGGNNLQEVLDKVEKNNGKVMAPKTQISSEMGYFGMFIGTEGNKMAVYSKN